MAIVNLQFPNARLLLHHLLSDRKRSVPSAIAQCASEYGLIRGDEYDRITQIESGRDCLCSSSMKKLLTTYFERRAARMHIPIVKAEEVWSAIETDAARVIRTSFSDKSHNCAACAPALFDLLLQQIGRYP